MYRARLRSLQTKEPALKYSLEVKKSVRIDVSELTGVRYKALDDLLDGIFCAYLAYYFWHWGAERSWVVGDTENGYVVLPRCKLTNCKLDAAVLLLPEQQDLRCALGALLSHAQRGARFADGLAAFLKSASLPPCSANR